MVPRRCYTMKYYNFNYETKEYYEVPAPEHDHYTYDYKTDTWYEIILWDISSAGGSE